MVSDSFLMISAKIVTIYIPGLLHSAVEYQNWVFEVEQQASLQSVDNGDIPLVKSKAERPDVNKWPIYLR